MDPTREFRSQQRDEKKEWVFISVTISNPGLLDWHVEVLANGNLQLEQEIYAMRDGGPMSDRNSEKIVTVLEESVSKIKSNLGLDMDESWLENLAQSDDSVRKEFFELALNSYEIKRENFVWLSFDD
jgi:hypothetical protein